MSRSPKLPVVLFVVIFALLLMQAFRGVGQYWDWTFPFYAEQIGTFFSRASESWTRDAGGSPLGYSSDYFARFGISLFGFLQPELLMYLLLVALFTAGAYGVYKIASNHMRGWLAFLFGLAAFINPTIFYKFTAGHIDYLISYDLLIFLAYFLFYRFKPDIRSGIVVGLTLALIGTQIQFFAIGAALIVLYFVVRPEQWRWKLLAPLLALPFLINMVWLSNFMFGGADLASVGGEAAKSSFKGASSANYANIFSFSFSKATLISRFYNPFELLAYGLIFVLMLVVILRAKRKQAEDVVLLGFLLVMLFMATGLFQILPLGPITTLYPMFREVGHFAPVIVLAVILLMSRLMPKGVTRWLCFVWLLLVIGISFAKFQTNAQSVNFATVRSQFAEFTEFAKTHNNKDYRVLSYPFFDQYALSSVSPKFQDKLPLKNSGHDSFAVYSPETFMKAAVKPQYFKQSPQYRLLMTMDVDVLKPYNVRYLYDFSAIYESYYDRYVPTSTFNNDVSLIKNNPEFFNQLLAANPDKLKRVSPHVLEIVDYRPRVATAGSIYNVDTNEQGEDARTFMQRAVPNQTFDYVSAETSHTSAANGMVKPLYNEEDTSKLVDIPGKSLKQTISLGENNKSASVYTNNSPRLITYKAQGSVLSFYASTSGKLYANDTLIQDNDAAPPQLLGQVMMQRGQQYYASLEGSIVPLKLDGSGVIGHLTDGYILELFGAASPNLIANPSFESGLWSKQVGDCNNYDKNPKIAMQQVGNASDGKSALELSAARHDACTSTNFNLKGDTTYLLSYDYQSPNAQSASFFMRFNESDQDAIKRFQTISDTEWHTTTQLITTPEKAETGQLFVHSLASDRDQPSINHYDNFRLFELQSLGQLSIPEPEASYTQHSLDISQKNPTFRFVDSSFDYKNIVRNGSFEDGPWQNKPIDCNNYDKDPKIAMDVSKSSKTDGTQALQLEATKHVSCTYTSVDVTPGTDYLLSFDYQGDPAAQAGYFADFSEVDGGAQDQIAITDRKWHTYSTKVHIPAMVTNIRLYLHAYESNGSNKNVVRFDNVKMVAVPSTDGQFYVVTKTNEALTQPQKIAFNTDSQTRRTIRVSGAKGPFVLSLAETYHPGWRLELDNAKVAGFGATLPGGQADAVGDHFQLSGYSNGWHVDPQKLCAHNAAGCTKQQDGSYDIALVAEFVPQRWFNVSRVISVSSLVLAGGYIAVTHRRFKRDLTQRGVYRHPLAAVMRKKRRR